MFTEEEELRLVVAVEEAEFVLGPWRLEHFSVVVKPPHEYHRDPCPGDDKSVNTSDARVIYTCWC